jgi:hypothetical protein
LLEKKRQINKVKKIQYKIGQRKLGKI